VPRLGHHLLRLRHVRLEHARAAAFAAPAAHERSQPARHDAGERGEDSRWGDGAQSRALANRGGCEMGGRLPIAVVEEIDGGRAGGFQVL
jgi:hypothetical protein